MRMLNADSSREDSPHQGWVPNTVASAPDSVRKTITAMAQLARLSDVSHAHVGDTSTSTGVTREASRQRHSGGSGGYPVSVS
jgi:hypothetical protein